MDPLTPTSCSTKLSIYWNAGVGCSVSASLQVQHTTALKHIAGCNLCSMTKSAPTGFASEGKSERNNSDCHVSSGN